MNTINTCSVPWISPSTLWVVAGMASFKMAGTRDKNNFRCCNPQSWFISILLLKDATGAKDNLQCRSKMLHSQTTFTNKRPSSHRVYSRYVLTCYYSQSSMPSPPLPHSLLNRRMPVTIMVSSVSCLSFSLLVSVMNVPSSVWGNTDCSAAGGGEKRGRFQNILKQLKYLNKVGKEKEHLRNQIRVWFFVSIWGGIG